MLTVPLSLLCAAALLGLGLATLHLAGSPLVRRVALLAYGHGLLGAAGLLALLPALAGPPRGVALGAGQFGIAGAVLLGLALLLATVLLAARLRRRALPSLVIGLHATLAIGGVIVLAAWASL